MLSAIASTLKNTCRRHSAGVIRTGLVSLLLAVGTVVSAVEVYLLPVAPVGKETDSVPSTMKIVRSSSIGALTVRLSLNTESTATLTTDYTVTGVDDPTFATPDPLDPITDPDTTTVTLLDGESERLVSIIPVDDGDVEAREAAVFTLKPIGLSYIIGAPSSMTATIADNDHQARIQVPDPIADEDSALFGLVGDPQVQRRAVMRVRFDEFLPVEEFTRNLAVQFTTSGGTRPIATLGTDYVVHYKICGNDSGATEERSRIGYDKVNILGTGLGYKIIAHLAGETQIDLGNDDFGISEGSQIRFNNHSQVYPVLSSGGSGITLGQRIVRTGTVSVTAGSATVSGTNTLFSSELAVGDSVLINNESKTIIAIANNTSMTVSPPFAVTANNVVLRLETLFPLVANLPNGTAITILDGAGDDSETVEYVYPAGTNSIKVDFGSGGLFEGDVFQLEGHDGFYVVTEDTRSLVPQAETAGTGTVAVSLVTPRVVTGSGTLFTQQLAVGDVLRMGGQARRVVTIISDTSLTVHSDFTSTVAAGTAFTYERSGTSGELFFRRYQGDGVGDGLEADASGSAALTTHIAATVTGGVMQVLVPTESTKVEISVTPTANGDGAEGAEEVRMRMIADEDYEILTPQESSIIIADRDVTASISVVSNAGLPNQTGFFKVTLSQPFSRAITVPYLVVDTLATGPAIDDDYEETVLPSVTFVSGQTEALVQVDPIQRGPASVTLTMIPTYDFKLSGSTSSGVNPSATMDISNSIGLVSIAATTPAAQESAVSPTNGQFTVSINRNVGQTGAVAVTLAVSGTAVIGSRYEFVNQSNVVISPTNNQIQVVIAASTNTATVGVRPINNFLADGDQIVQLQVVDGPSYLVGTPTTASVTVDDDEPQVSVTFGDDAARPSTPGFFTFSYSGAALSQAVVVNFTYSGTGVINTDYTAATSVTIPANNTSETLFINPIDTAEGNAATVTVTITPSTTYTIGAATATIDILASDAPAGNKPTPGTINSGAAGGGCGLGSGFATLIGLGLFALLALRRRD